MSAKYFCGEGEAFAGLYVAENEKHGVVGHVVGLEECLDVGKIGGVEIGEIAVEIVGVGPVAEGDRRKIEPGKAAVGLVHHVDADFFFDDVALVAQIFVVDFECAHAVGFQPEDAVERVGRHGFVVVGDVVVRGAVEQAAAGIDQLDVLHLGRVGGALKHHVLEEMGEAAAALRLEAKTDLVVDAEGDDRRGGIRRDYNFQAVRQRRAFDWNLESVHPLPPVECALDFADASWLRLAESCGSR